MNELEKKYYDLLNAVANMRRLQKMYFKCRTGQNLTAAKKAETNIDKLVNLEVEKALELFDSQIGRGSKGIVN